jgi:histidyl-tRNA synthetase
MSNKSKIKPTLGPGFRDLSGDFLATKKKIIQIIEDNYLRYGYTEISQPSLEISSQIGSYLSEDSSNPMSDVFLFENNKESLMLRYDLTSQMTRYVATNYRDLPSTFKNYRMGNVWRQEKPSPNMRLREFFQADFDILGNSNQPQVDAEICNLIADIFSQIGFKKNEFKISITNLKIIQGLINDNLKITDPKKIQQISRSIDKKSRLGLKSVKELLGKGRKDDSGAFTKGCELSESQIDEIINFLKINNLEELKSVLKNPLSIEGIDELSKLLDQASFGDFFDFIELSMAIQRGLSYYSSFAIETNIQNLQIKDDKNKIVDLSGISCASGGRYSKLTSRFGVDIDGSGASIGCDRVSFISNQFKNRISNQTQKPVAILILDEKFYPKYYEILKILRDNKINSEIYPGGNVKLQKQFQYCDKNSNPIAVMIGQEEVDKNLIKFKVIQGEKDKNEFLVTKEKLIDEIRKFI